MLRQDLPFWDRHPEVTCDAIEPQDYLDTILKKFAKGTIMIESKYPDHAQFDVANYD